MKERKDKRRGMNEKYSFPVYDLTPIEDANGVVLLPAGEIFRFKIRFKIRLL